MIVPCPSVTSQEKDGKTESNFSCTYNATMIATTIQDKGLYNVHMSSESLDELLLWLLKADITER